MAMSTWTTIERKDNLPGLEVSRVGDRRFPEGPANIVMLTMLTMMRMVAKMMVMMTVMMMVMVMMKMMRTIRR